MQQNTNSREKKTVAGKPKKTFGRAYGKKSSASVKKGVSRKVYNTFQTPIKISFLGGLNETTYNNTISIGQLKSATEDGMVSELEKELQGEISAKNDATNAVRMNCRQSDFIFPVMLQFMAHSSFHQNSPVPIEIQIGCMGTYDQGSGVCA